MTAEEWYAADIAARQALAVATAARHQDWLAECAAVQARHDAQQITSAEATAATNARAAADHALAVAQTAQAAAVQAAAEASAAAMAEPQWNRKSLTIWFLARLPEVTGLTDLQRTDLAIKQADELLKRIP
jgi:hypothetical protein